MTHRRCLLLALALATLLPAQDTDRRPPREAETFLTQIPDTAGSVILGRPTRTGVTASLLWKGGGEGLLVYGTDPRKLPATGKRVALPKDRAVEVVLEGLVPDTAYAYALVDPASGRRLLPLDGPGRFHTARAPGKGFTFTVTADSHLDSGCLLERYARTLEHIRSEAPDFHIDLGDTFMTEKHPTRESAAAQYVAQRHWLGQVGAVAPLFLVLGNHDGEGPSPRDPGLEAWSFHQRTALFPNPLPDGFYSCPPQAPPRQDAYAWTWGDACFIVLDPYPVSRPTRGGREPWNLTLGEGQRAWLEGTLKAARTPFIFVFIHQLTGSDQPAGRGGAEASAFLEWGGRTPEGEDGFARHRPGWPQPLHALLVRHGVTAVFHGHDHFYAHQERDGVAYLLAPQPAHRQDRTHPAEAYGYRTGTFLPNSGHLRVDVARDGVRVSYLRTDRTGTASVADAFALRPRPGQ